MTTPKNINKEQLGEELLLMKENPNAPLACDMTGAPDTPKERLREYVRLFEHALIGRERLETAVEFSFARKPGVAEWVVDLARREATCCPFFSHEVRRHGDRLTWRTSSEVGQIAQAFLDELYAGPERFPGDDGIKGLFERLAGRGVEIESTPTGFTHRDGQGGPGFLGKLKAVCRC